MLTANVATVQRQVCRKQKDEVGTAGAMGSGGTGRTKIQVSVAASRGSALALSLRAEPCLTLWYLHLGGLELGRDGRRRSPDAGHPEADGPGVLLLLLREEAVKAHVVG